MTLRLLMVRVSKQDRNDLEQMRAEKEVQQVLRAPAPKLLDPEPTSSKAGKALPHEARREVVVLHAQNVEQFLAPWRPRASSRELCLALPWLCQGPATHHRPHGLRPLVWSPAASRPRVGGVSTASASSASSDALQSCLGRSIRAPTGGHRLVSGHSRALHRLAKLFYVDFHSSFSFF